MQKIKRYINRNSNPDKDISQKIEQGWKKWIYKRKYKVFRN